MGNRRQYTVALEGEPPVLAADVWPVLTYGSRVYVDDKCAARLCPPAGEPALDRRPGSVRMRYTRREIAVEGDLALLWNVLRLADGDRTTDEIVAALPLERRST